MLAGIDSTTWVVIIAVAETVIVLRILWRPVTWQSVGITVAFGMAFSLLAVAGPTVSGYWLAAASNAFLYVVIAGVRLIARRAGPRCRRSQPTSTDERGRLA